MNLAPRVYWPVAPLFRHTALPPYIMDFGIGVKAILVLGKYLNQKTRQIVH